MLVGAVLFFVRAIGCGFTFGVWDLTLWRLVGGLSVNIASVIAAAARCIANFLITLSFPPLASVSLVLTYGMYALFAGLSFLCVFKVVPETNGMSLGEAETLFIRAPKPAK
jgi:Sugar (and other) transporter